MFSIEEAMAWTAEEAVLQLKQAIPSLWKLKCSTDADGWFQITLLDEKEQVLWSGEHVDLKILALDVLGWFCIRDYQIQNPVWTPRKKEVPLYRPPVSEKAPDPPDLDPDEIDAVYRDFKNRE
jgi:hypothetical protein